MRLPVSVIIVAAVSFLLPAAAGAAERAPVLQVLNAQRAAHGIPAGITENPAWSAGCNAHENYMTLNGYFGHYQDSDKPGYTPEGAEAGSSSVLGYGGWGYGDPYYADSNPFEFAPFHLAQLLAPKLSVTGFSDGGGCVNTLSGRERPYPDDQTRIYSYPGDGTKDWRVYEITAELPYTPGERLGLRASTGPHIYLFPFGPSGESMALASGTLTGPSGEVIETRSVDSHDPDYGFLISGGIVIPVKALAPETTYTLRSDWKLLAPAGTWTYDQKVADLKRIWTLFAFSEEWQKQKLDAFSKLDANRQNLEWSYIIPRCERAATGRHNSNWAPYNKPLPSDTECRIFQSSSDTRSFSTEKGTTRDDQDSDNSSSDTTRISLRTKPRGRSVRLTLSVGSTWIGQRINLRLSWRSGHKTVRKTQSVTLKKKTFLTLKAPWKTGRVTLNVLGAIQATGDPRATVITHKRSWKIR